MTWGEVFLSSDISDSQSCPQKSTEKKKMKQMKAHINSEIACGMLFLGPILLISVQAH